MYLHIGNSKTVHFKDIIGIFNLDLRKKEVNRHFLEFTNRGEGFSKEEYAVNKSFVLTKNKIFLSPISAHTLAKR